MDIQQRAAQFKRNPKTHAEHRRQVFWQITLPLVIGSLVVLGTLAVIIFSATQPVTDLSRWADISLIWLILPSLILALIILAILVALVVLITYVMRVIPRYALIVQLYIELAKDKLNKVFNFSVEPLLRIKTIWAAFRFATRLGKKEVPE